MGASKIVNETEVLRWFEEGRTYDWMVEQYRRKYNIETGVSMWANFRARRGLPRRIARIEEIMPWEVKVEHRWKYPAQMLRYEGRKREGMDLSPGAEHKLALWREFLERNNVVVHYLPETDEGFFYVPRRKTDEDIVRAPKRIIKSRRRQED